MITLLSGGTGGAKLARGLLDVAGEGELATIANTGDDIAAFGLHVSPDCDLITYWLTDLIDEERGYGLRGDTRETFDQLVALGAPEWFELGDKDLATCLVRTQLLHEGRSLTEIARHIAEALGARAYVLPMCEEPVQTYVRTDGEWRHFQEYLILQGSRPEVEGVEFRGVEAASLGDEVRRAIELAEVIVIGPSNPIASIGPILAVPGLRQALADADAPVVAVSPLIAGRSLKGPTEAFLRWAGHDVSDSAIVAEYADLADGIVVDRSSSHGRPSASKLVLYETDTNMQGAAGRTRLARETVQFARSLAG